MRQIVTAVTTGYSRSLCKIFVASSNFSTAREDLKGSRSAVLEYEQPLSGQRLLQPMFSATRVLAIWFKLPDTLGLALAK